MALHLFNTLSGKTELFEPSEDKLVRMYSCGPTVYDYGHIGNFRTFVMIDLLRRFLRMSGYRLKHVMNITDVDDKIIHNAAKEHVDVRTYTQKYVDAFLEDSRILNLEKPEYLVRATDHISEMADFIEALQKKGYAYRTDDGSYYFPIARFPGYGKLSKKDFAGMEDGARVDLDEYEKENARDFALWKGPKPGEAQWQTSIGPGRPGWHIECSVMSMKYLGESFDIHLGGEDLIFPHHENEIAQSEAMTGKTLARFWMHVRFLLVNGNKMSKSLGNFYTPRDLILMGYKPSSIRYLLASVPYGRQLNFTFDGLKQAAASVGRLREFKLRLETASFPETGIAAFANLAKTGFENMRAALDDNLNTAEALAAVFEMIRQANVAADAGKLGKRDAKQLLQTLEAFDRIFDVLQDNDADKMREVAEWGRAHGKEVKLAPAVANGLSEAQIEALIAERATAKGVRDFKRADAIRKQLADAGIILEDTKDGVRWKRG